ncbi:MAG: (d)CMP kinase [Phycisphaerales bacterium]|jgi:cytidylate kinase|nr:(d)CMP kinase [Phycisphaerales bacterium]
MTARADATVPLLDLPEIAHPLLIDVVPADQPIIITIDGPAGTGKSSVARALAKHLGLDFLDTGAMYRAAAAIALDHGIDVADRAALVAKVESADLHFDWRTDPPAILAWDTPLNGRIRDLDVTSIVSGVAAIAELRAHMVRKQRLIAQQHPRLVTEGRDQGSVVFPSAALKFYLDASPAIRARRRAAQLAQAGAPAPAIEALEHEIIERDRSDSARADGPLICPDDAVIVDTSHLTFAEVVGRLLAESHARIAPRS